MSSPSDITGLAVSYYECTLHYSCALPQSVEGKQAYCVCGETAGKHQGEFPYRLSSTDCGGFMLDLPRTLCRPVFEYYDYSKSHEKPLYPLVREVDGKIAICTCGKSVIKHDGAFPYKSHDGTCKEFVLNLTATLESGEPTFAERVKLMTKSATGREGTPLTKEQIIEHFEEFTELYRKNRATTPREEWNKWWPSWSTHVYATSKGPDWAYVEIAKNLGIKPKIQEDLVNERKSRVKWETILTELINNGCKRVLLVGPPGTGKSTTAMLYTGTKWRITMTEGTCVEELIGMFQLINGETVWVDGPLTAAMRNGEPIIIDEIDHHSTEIGSLLYAAADDHPQIMLPTKEMVYGQKGYALIATSNANINALPEAIIDRMEAVVLAITPHPDALKEMEANEKAAVISHFRALDKTPWKWSGKPTLRRMAAFSKLRKTIKKLDEDVIADAVFGSSGKEIISALATSAAKATNA